MKISRELVDEMVAHAREDVPNECCGMIGGSGGVATRVVPVKNAAASPLRYEMDPKEMFEAYTALEEEGELLGIYHSHTKSAAYPSQTDVNQGQNWPDQVYVIVSLADADAPDVKAYELRDLKIAEVALEVE